MNQASDPSVESYIRERAAMVNDALSRIIPMTWDIPKQLRSAMDYSLTAGGKRLRPVLVIAAAEACGGKTEDALPIACAVECVHTYSLIHDDLPAMDDDDYRRGKPTNHKVYGEACAILAGDALLTHAFWVAARSSRQGIAAGTILEIIADLAELAGPRGMVGGQAADLAAEQGGTNLQQLKYIHAHKTADLIVFSLTAGGRIAGADEARLSALRTFGAKIGLAFQIQDDILDITGDKAKLGKSPNSDEKQNKVTYPYLIGLDQARKEADVLVREAKQALNDAGFPRPERLHELADFMTARTH